MRALLTLSAGLLLAAGVASAAAPNGKSHANTLLGTVTVVDTAARTLVVKDSRGKETRLVWTSATHVTGGELKQGEKVTVRWLSREGKKIATVVKVHAEEAEKNASGTPPASLSPTPKTP
ncbi:MAG: hypothetical protein ACM3SU_07375 [Acidobacteriota bacterium]